MCFKRVVHREKGILQLVLANPVEDSVLVGELLYVEAIADQRLYFELLSYPDVIIIINLYYWLGFLHF